MSVTNQLLDELLALRMKYEHDISVCQFIGTLEVFKHAVLLELEDQPEEKRP